jgi:hypothetical protein
VTQLEDFLREYYATKADSLVLPDRVLDGDLGDSVSYISIGPEPRRRAPMLLAAAASIALIAGAGVLVTRNSPTRGPVVVGNATTTIAATGDFPLLAATWLPEGYVLTGGSDGSDESFPGRTLIYRDYLQPPGSPTIFISVTAPQPAYPGSEITIRAAKRWTSAVREGLPFS